MQLFKENDIVVVVRDKPPMVAGYLERMAGKIGYVFQVNDVMYVENDFYKSSVYDAAEDLWWDMSAVRFATVDEVKWINQFLDYKVPGYDPLKDLARELFPEKGEKKLPKKPKLYSLLREDPKFGRELVDYALRFKKKKDQIHAGDICCARMNWGHDDNHYAGDEMLEIVMTIDNRINKFKDDFAKKNYEKYAKYVLYKSPYKHCFIKQSWEKNLKEGVRFNLDRDIGQIIGASVALREGWEFYHKVELFVSLCEKGFTQDVAYFVSSFLKAIGKNDWMCWGGPHTALYHTMTYEVVLDFFARRDFDNPGVPIRTNKIAFFRIFEQVEKAAMVYGFKSKNPIDEVFKKIGKAERVGSGLDAIMKMSENAHINIAKVVKNDLKKRIRELEKKA